MLSMVMSIACLHQRSSSLDVQEVQVEAGRCRLALTILVINHLACIFLHAQTGIQ
jgi:hypothetical protein